MQQRQELPPTIEQFLHALESDTSDQSETQPPETIHVYVEDDRITLVQETPEIVESTPPPPRDTTPLVAGILMLFIMGCLLILVLVPQPVDTTSFTLTVSGYRLPPVHQSLTVQAKATGEGYIAPTTAHGVIVFYNGQPYTQIIPVSTLLKGSDGVEVITDTQAIIPPAAQTTPPTYGVVSVPAHASVAGAIGNIQAGDINMSCCVTSVIAQNPYAFHGGRDAQHFTSITKQDVANASVPLLTTLEEKTPQLFRSSVVLAPRCTPTIGTKPTIGQRATTVRVTVTVSCSAVSYNRNTVLKALHAYSSRLGQGSFINVVYQVVSIDKQERITLYVTATWKPSLVPSQWFRK